MVDVRFEPCTIVTESQLVMPEPNRIVYWKLESKLLKLTVTKIQVGRSAILCRFSPLNGRREWTRPNCVRSSDWSKICLTFYHWSIKIWHKLGGHFVQLLAMFCFSKTGFNSEGWKVVRFLNAINIPGVFEHGHVTWQCVLGFAADKVSRTGVAAKLQGLQAGVALTLPGATMAPFTRENCPKACQTKTNIAWNLHCSSLPPPTFKNLFKSAHNIAWPTLAPIPSKTCPKFNENLAKKTLPWGTSFPHLFPKISTPTPLPSKPCYRTFAGPLEIRIAPPP